MATVYDEKALDVLTTLAQSGLDPAQFRSQLDSLLPGWQTGCGENGYTEPGAETSIKVSRALHDSLPKPFNQREYNWRDTHGFKEVLFYVDWPDRTAGELGVLITNASRLVEAILSNT